MIMQIHKNVLTMGYRYSNICVSNDLIQLTNVPIIKKEVVCMEKYFMGIDTGTQGVRIGICNKKGEMVYTGEKKWKTIYPEVGWAEQHPDTWWDGITGLFEEISKNLRPEQLKEIRACCVCATSSTVIPVTVEGEPLMNAMMWMDARSREEMNFINATGHPVLQFCGEETSFEWMVPKALWMKKHRRELYDSCYKIVEQLDWINFKLTGEFSSSICNTTCKWNYVSSLGGYQDDFFEMIGFADYREKLVTDVYKIGDPIGKIRAELAKRFNFSEDMEIVCGSIDAHMALFGMNVLEENKLGIIMGTSFVHLCFSKDMPVIKGIWGPYENAILDGYWLLEGGQISASGLVNWFKENFHIEGTPDNPYKILTETLKKTDIGAEGLTVLDFFQGNRTPYKDGKAKGVIYGLNVKHTWEHIYRALLEAISFGTFNIIKNYEEQGYSVNSITACGGVTKDEAWMQMIADISGKEITINRDSQAGVLGCCVVSASQGRYYKTFQEAAGHMVTKKKVIKPDLSKHERYRKPFLKYLDLYTRLKDMMAAE